MDFDPAVYGQKVADILALDENGSRLMPLVFGPPESTEAVAKLRSATAKDLFPSAPAPEAALAGLWLYFSCFEESHSISQDIPTADGSYWHGILHRREPDPDNAAYWFRRAGRHPIFPALHEAAQAIVAESAKPVGLRQGTSWDPIEFITFCETARRRPGSHDELAARRIALAEWQLLFHYCATTHV